MIPDPRDAGSMRSTQPHGHPVPSVNNFCPLRGRTYGMRNAWLSPIGWSLWLIKYQMGSLSFPCTNAGICSPV